MGRSGTRMCANILRNSSLVELQGELGGPAGTRLLAWLEAALAQRRIEDFDTRYDFVRRAFRLSAPGRPSDRPHAIWFGHKTPRHERHFRRYETLFDNPENRPVYVYCLRNPFDVWRSYQAMPWNKFRDVDTFLEAWLRSVAVYELIAERAPDRVLVFNLDRMLRAADWRDYLEPTLFQPLGLSGETFSRPVITLRNSNSSLNKTGARPDPISEADRRAIARQPEVRRIAAEHFPWLGLPPPPPGLIRRDAKKSGRMARLRRTAVRAWRQARREWNRPR
ncbi:MAG: hypothetical protein C0461_10955 [Brevundimonas sp.]|nr:hypothetical protein [Brevundimonas sp.]